jgi:hypothetical protein
MLLRRSFGVAVDAAFSQRSTLLLVFVIVAIAHNSCSCRGLQQISSPSSRSVTGDDDKELFVQEMSSLHSMNERDLEENLKNNTAKKEEVFSRCGFTSTARFQTWYEILFTDSPVLFPKDDEELLTIVTTARTGGCRVRVRGAGHCEDGVVMQKTDQDDARPEIVKINLSKYNPPNDWNGVLNTNNPDRPTIRISAGASLLEMNGLVRPKGYLPISSYPLSTFSVGGAYLNPTTHGATFGASRLAAHVVGVRVLKSSGVIEEYHIDSNEETLKAFRGSMGLLGIVTALEIQLRKDTGLAMTRDSIHLGRNKVDLFDVRAFVSDKFSNYDGVEFFWYPPQDMITAYQLDFNGNPSFDPASTTTYYDELIEKYPDLAFTGGIRESFSVHIIEAAASTATTTRGIADAVSIVAATSSDKSFDETAKTRNDGFFLALDTVPWVEIVFYSAPCAPPPAGDNDPPPTCLNEFMLLFEATRSYFQTLLGDPHSDWYPALFVEWRIFDVKEDELQLEMLSPGTYLAFESIALILDNDIRYSKYHRILEALWMGLVPGGSFNFGKEYAYGSIPGLGDDKGLYYPYQNDAILDKIFSQDVRERFLASMEEHDPDGLFRAGSMLRLLGVSEEKYTPKQYVGGSCKQYGDAECLSSCCNKKGVCC